MTAARTRRVTFNRLSAVGLFTLLLAWQDVDDDSFLASPEPLTQLETEMIFRKRLPKAYRHEAGGLAGHLVKLCAEHHFDPAFVLSLIHVESTFNPRARSHKGALGLMQFLPSTAEYIAKRRGIPYKHKNELYDPYVNLTLGLNYLSFLRKRFDTPDQVLAAYNLGPNRVRQNLELGDYKMSVIRPYVDKIKKGVARIHREGSDLALVATYANTLATRENGLWRGLAALVAASDEPARPRPAVHRVKGNGQAENPR